MKRIALFLALTCAAPALAQQVRLTVDVPDLLSSIGFGPPTVIALVSDVPLYGTVVSFEGVVGDISPYGMVYDRQTPGFRYYRFPVAVLYYDTPARTHLVGIAAIDMSVSAARENVRTVHFGEVRFLDGAGHSPLDFPVDEAGAATRVEFPKISWGPTTVVLVANARRFEVGLTILTSGEPGIRRIPSGGLEWLVCDNTLGSTQTVELVLTKMEHGYGVGTTRRSFRPSASSPESHAYLIDRGTFPWR